MTTDTLPQQDADALHRLQRLRDWGIYRHVGGYVVEIGAGIVYRSEPAECLADAIAGALELAGFSRGEVSR